LDFLAHYEKPTGPGLENQSIEEIISKSTTAVEYQTKDCAFSRTRFQHLEATSDAGFWEVALGRVQSPVRKLVGRMGDSAQMKRMFEDVELQC
jgi:hypothetical protein